MKNIVVEKGLSTIRDYLSDRGYHVREIDITQQRNNDFASGADAVVVTGMNDNIMGIQTTSTKVPFIEAKGMTPDDVLNAIERKVH